MPPFLSTFRSRTNSLLDTITGSIPDSPPNGTFKDRSLTCRRCGNRFRDALELSSHFNLLPHHSDYSDSHDYDSFIRPKHRPAKSQPLVDQANSAPVTAGFSEAEAFYTAQEKEKKTDRPALLRKFPTFSSLTTTTIGDHMPTQGGTDYSDDRAGQLSPSAKAKGKQKALPRLRRDDSFPYAQPIPSSDEEDTRAPGPSNSVRSRARSATTQALVSQPPLPQRPRRSTSSSIASRSTASKRREAPALPPKIPAFDWQDDDAASVNSDASFRTADTNEYPNEKAAIKQSSKAGSDNFKASEHTGSTTKSVDKRRDGRPVRTRHASESDLLLGTVEAPDYDAPPSYHELHGDKDSFDDLRSASSRPQLTTRAAPSRSSGFASVPTSPMSRLHIGTWQRTRRSINAWATPISPVFPVSFGSSQQSAWATGENDLYDTGGRSNKDGSVPQLATSSSFSSLPSPSTPKTPPAPFGEATRATSPFSLALPSLPQPVSSSRAEHTSGKKSRNSSRAKSDAKPPSTRCPTCFAKFVSLDKTLEHLDSSECGAIEFESGIM